MDRCRFIRDVLRWPAGVSLAIPNFTILTEVLAAEQPQPLLALNRDEDYHALVGRALAPLGGMGKYVNPGDRVVIKPNFGWDRTPEQGANTRPLAIRAGCVGISRISPHPCGGRSANCSSLLSFSSCSS
ncbi:MAG: hypothetical protein WBN83_16655 [Desulfoprunum sp.]|jgi:hypothetical protein|uniref:hypothetical protein n=1 Tax=Desulfoprunum sp. TaxID=2020866 RepID=UPI0006908F67